MKSNSTDEETILRQLLSNLMDKSDASKSLGSFHPAAPYRALSRQAPWKRERPQTSLLKGRRNRSASPRRENQSSSLPASPPLLAFPAAVDRSEKARRRLADRPRGDSMLTCKQTGESHEHYQSTRK